MKELVISSNISMTTYLLETNNISCLLLEDETKEINKINIIDLSAYIIDSKH